MEWNRALQTLGPHIRDERCLTPDYFMDIVFRLWPQLDEACLVSWQRSLTQRSWERDVCDFMWLYWKWSRGNRTDWRPHVERAWPAVRVVVQTHRLVDELETLCM